MHATVTTEDIGARAHDLMVPGRIYSAADLAALRTEAEAQLLAEDEGNLGAAARAVECAMLRDFLDATPRNLQADYDKHHNAWPFSGDHLGARHIREEYYVPGYGTEQGDVIGRERVRTVSYMNVWAMVR